LDKGLKPLLMMMLSFLSVKTDGKKPTAKDRWQKIDGKRSLSPTI
jgi:hypothetical protein